MNPVSVVVSWRHRTDPIGRCLDSLLSARRAGPLEIVIVGSLRDRSAADKYLGDGSGAEVRFVRGPRGMSDVTAWGLGLTAARERHVAFTQARCTVCDDWPARAAEPLPPGVGMAGGPVGLAEPAGVADRAAFLCDYGDFADPPPQGPDTLAANNCVFDRRWLSRYHPGGPLHKTAVVAAARAAGERFDWRPAMRVAMHPSAPAWVQLAERGRRGADYARIRSAGWPTPVRWAAGAAAPLLTALLTWRLWRRSCRAPRERRPGPAELPAVAVWMLAWSLGEAAGYWSPRPAPATMPAGP